MSLRLPSSGVPSRRRCSTCRSCSPARSPSRMLAVSPLPQVDFPAISVSASLPGASPETMASSVATPLERALGTIAGVNEITSCSSQGSTRIIVQFDLGKDINAAAREVQAAINASRVAAPERAARHAELPQDQPVAGADHDPGADVETRTHERALRPRLDGAGAEGGAGDRRRRRDRRRRVSAGRPRRAPAERARPLRHLARRRPPAIAARTCSAEGRRRGRRARIGRSRRATSSRGRRIRAADRPLP